jgi:hypothetical protein
MDIIPQILYGAEPQLIGSLAKYVLSKEEKAAYNKLDTFFSDDDAELIEVYSRKIVEGVRNNLTGGRSLVYGWPEGSTNREPDLILCYDLLHAELILEKNAIRTQDGTLYESCLVFHDHECVCSINGFTYYGHKPIFYWHENPPRCWHENSPSSQSDNPTGTPSKVSAEVLDTTKNVAELSRRELRKLETQALYRLWQKAYVELRRQHSDKSETWIADQISRRDISKKRSIETIRKNMKPK